MFLIPWTVTDFQCRKQAAVRHGLESYRLLREKKKRDQKFISMRFSFPKTVSTIDPALRVTSMRRVEEMQFLSQCVGVWEKSHKEYFYSFELQNQTKPNSPSFPPI